jgi:NitT/TauT family transport system ATP-binding protein
MLLKNIAIHYQQKNQSGEVVAVKQFDYQFQSGKTYAIIGPSGCGKSSILLSMAGLIQPTMGTVEYMGLPLLQPHSAISLILQDYGLFPWKTVWENATLGLALRGKMTEQKVEQVQQILKFLGLHELGKRYPKELSGGQRQRVAIARALATNPQLLLMDEPLSALDALTREAMQDLLLDIWQRQQLTLVIVTHNIEEAVFLGQEIIVMTSSPGEIRSVFNNPYCGDHTFRSSNHFYQYCSDIRKQLLPTIDSLGGGKDE